MYALEKIALVLAVIGAVNWGLVAFFNLDVIASIFNGATTTGARILYALIGIAGLICLVPLFRGDARREHRVPG